MPRIVPGFGPRVRAHAPVLGLLGLMLLVPSGGGVAQDVPAAPPQADTLAPQATPDPQQPNPPAQIPQGAIGQQPAPVPAQPPQQTRRGEDCEPVGYRVLNSVLQPGGTRMTQMGLPEFVCADGVRVSADSAVDYEMAGRIQFIGGFRYEDADRIMTAVDADYFEAQGRLFGRGSVEVLSRDGLSEIRGDTLDLYEGFEGSADDQLVVRGRPAFALFYPDESDDSESTGEPPADSAAASSSDDAPSGATPEGMAENGEPTGPYELSGVVLRFNGENFIHADGGAELVRDSLRGTADQIDFARESGVLTLLSNARLESDGSVFEGDEIELQLPDDELVAIHVRGTGSLRTEDLALDAAEIRIDMEDGEMRHLVAVRRAGVPAAPPAGDAVPSGPLGEPARAESDAFVLVGDSIDVRSEGGVLRTAWAVGAARAVAAVGGDAASEDVGEAQEAPLDLPADTVPVVSVAPGSDGGASEPAPESSESEGGSLATLLAEDWIEGDTIEVVFAPGVASEDEDEPAYVLEALIATGNARSLYRSPPEEVDAQGRPITRPPRDAWAISYMLADRIELAMVDGTVDNVRSAGNVVGEYLEPIPPSQSMGDSTSVSGDR